MDTGAGMAAPTLKWALVLTTVAMLWLHQGAVKKASHRDGTGTNKIRIWSHMAQLLNRLPDPLSFTIVTFLRFPGYPPRLLALMPPLLQT